MCEAGCAGARVSQHDACSMLDDGGDPAGDQSNGTIFEPQKTCIECVRAGRSWQVGQVRVPPRASSHPISSPYLQGDLILSSLSFSYPHPFTLIPRAGPKCA